MHPGYWVLRQIALTCPTASLFVRARVPSRSRVRFRHIDSLENVADQWDRWLFPALNEYSERGSLIEYAINPRAEGPRNPEVVGTAVCVGLLPGRHFTLKRRLRQIAIRYISIPVRHQFAILNETILAVCCALMRMHRES